MQVEIQHGPANAAARVILNAGETLTAEAGAMIAMSGSMKVETTTLKKGSGGVLKALKRMIAGESFFLNHFTAGKAGDDVWLAPTLPGDVTTLDLGAEAMIVQGGSFLACEHQVNVDLGWQGFKSLFAGESVFWLKIKGPGKALVTSFGSVYWVDVDGEYIVDSGHIVAFPESLKFVVTKAGKSWISSILGGEGLVCKFQGKGRVLCQSHNAQGFGGALGPLLRPRN